jgi:hypothetical protein
MEFLKELFTEPLSYEAFEKAVNAKGFKLADLSGGEYVSKDKFDKANNELKEVKETLTTVTTELDGLKANNASAEEWRQKYETLQHDVSEKERIAKEQAAEAEKEANLKARYSAVCVSKDGKPLEWAHDAIKDAYFAKFVEAVEDKANQGKSDADIFNSLTKDDPTAFKGVQAVTLVGGKPLGMSTKMTREDISKIKDPIERRQAIANNLELYQTEE